VDCSGTVDAYDAVLLALAAADIAIETPGGCVPLDFGSPSFGDLNCDGTVDQKDLIGPLAFVADVFFSQTDGCTEIGSEL
jgi:hypothetical protein